jgi:hypothetical protein
VEESPDVLLNVFASEMEREGVEGLEMDETKFSCHHAPSLPVIQDDETSHGYLNAHFDGMEELGEVNQSLETRSNSEDSTSTLELEEDIECCEIPGCFVSSEDDSKIEQERFNYTHAILIRKLWTKLCCCSTYCLTGYTPHIPTCYLNRRTGLDS